MLKSLFFSLKPTSVYLDKPERIVQGDKELLCFLTLLRLFQRRNLGPVEETLTVLSVSSLSLYPLQWLVHNVSIYCCVIGAPTEGGDPINRAHDSVILWGYVGV